MFASCSTSMINSETRQQSTRQLQHTATHCNTLRHNAKHCNMLVHICNTLQHTSRSTKTFSKPCDALQLQCGTVAVWYSCSLLQFVASVQDKLLRMTHGLACLFKSFHRLIFHLEYILISLTVLF